MAIDRRNLVEVLRAELDFLEGGGYQKIEKTSWRPPFFFEDSPTCLCSSVPVGSRRCAACALSPLVPVNCRQEQAPCRYIPLNGEGETLDSLYRTGSAEEIEAALGKWLKAEIRTLEPVKQRHSVCQIPA